jgi:phosphate transport system permease protein
LGVGASKHEAIFHHILPLAMPTIMTGAIISLARALGESAPLLLIGMNAFITSPPDGVFEASTALPTQIFMWADSPERGFVARTSAAILVLLGFLVLMNGIAIFLRQRFERRW